MGAPKRGRLSKEAQAYIVANATRKTPEEIAAHIERTPEMVAEYIRKFVAMPATTPDEVDEAEKVTIRAELRQSETWRNLQMEFTKEELRFFEEGYVKLMAQFRGDVLASEEVQIFQAIKFEILMSRNLQERKRAREEIARLERQQGKFLDGFEANPAKMKEGDRALAMSLETQLNIARRAEQDRTGEYVKLQERHEALMKALKAVRDQRIKEVEKSKVDYLGVVKMLQNRDVQEREMRQRELMRLAGDKEYVRLGRPTKYEDGNMDSPILSCETVDLGPEEAGPDGQEEDNE